MFREPLDVKTFELSYYDSFTLVDGFGPVQLFEINTKQPDLFAFVEYLYSGDVTMVVCIPRKIMRHPDVASLFPDNAVVAALKEDSDCCFVHLNIELIFWNCVKGSLLPTYEAVLFLSETLKKAEQFLIELAFKQVLSFPSLTVGHC